MCERTLSRSVWVAARSLPRKLGDRPLGAIVIDERFASSGRGDQRGNGSVVQRARQTQADLMQPSDGIVSKQRIGTTDRRMVGAEV